MKLDDIVAMWQTDSVLNEINLGSASIEIPKLHHKYMTIYTGEKLKLIKNQSDLAVLKKLKTEFYTMGPSTKDGSDLPTHWTVKKLPPKGAIIRTDAPMYVETDDDVVEFTLKVSHQLLKVEYLESVLKMLTARTFHIKNAIEFIKFRGGAI